MAELREPTRIIEVVPVELPAPLTPSEREPTVSPQEAPEPVPAGATDENR